MKTRNVLWIGIGLLGLVGCSSMRTTSEGIRVAKLAPDWVMKGGVAFAGDDGKALYGVGVSGKSINPAMKRERADHRSKVELSRGIKTYVAAFTKDYMREHPDYFDPKAAGSEEYTEKVSKEVSEATLEGVQIVDRWEGPDGSFYALARLPKADMDAKFAEKMRAVKGALLKEKTEQALRDLDSELKKVDLREKKEAEKFFRPAPESEK